MIKIGIIGVLGKVGKEIVNSLFNQDWKIEENKHLENKQFVIGNSFSRVNAECKFEEFFPLIHTEALIMNDLEKVFATNDIVIDFSSFDLFKDCLKIAKQNKAIFISGTTGDFNEDTISEMKEVGKHIKLCWSPNMSLSVNIINHALEEFGRLFQNHDCEIIETHHRMKKDAPGGTAILFGKSVAKGRGVEFESVANLNRMSNPIRKKNEIGFSAIRGGQIFGQNEVMFIDNNEIIKIQHEACNRSIFANGALEIAKKLYSKKEQNGYFTFKELLF